MSNVNKVNVAEFNKVLQAWSKNRVPEEVVKLHKILAMEALKRLVLKTPVDTGRARGNWQVTTVPVNNEIVYKGGRIKKGKQVVKQGAAQARPQYSENVVAKGAPVIEKIQPFSVIYLTNNVPYIERLENGWSRTQAPNGMLLVTLAELRGMFP